jgi:urease accessory protein UreH
VHAELAIGLHRAGDGSVVARGALAVAPFWCRWDGATLWIVGSAATPVGEDDITIDLQVGEGVSATVRSVAASVVYAARGEGTRMTTRLHVAAGASLTWQPEPVIVTEEDLRTKEGAHWPGNPFRHRLSIQRKGKRLAP